MAANFSSVGNICEGENCEVITDVTYYVTKKKTLCDGCASKEGCIGKTRKGGSNLYCEEHDEEIKLYCKTHCVALCYSCALTDHRQLHCVQQGLDRAIKESKASLITLKEQAKDKMKLCRVYGDQIHKCKKDTDTHLQALKDEVDLEINKAIQTDRDKEEEDAAKINQEIDEKNKKLQDEIKQINEKMQKNDEEREKRLQLNHTNAEKRREPISNKRHVLQTDIQNIADEKERKIGQLEISWQDNTTTTETAIQKIDSVLKDDSNVVEDGHRLKTSVSDELKKPLNEGEVKQITDTISGVRFVKGAGREKYDGRIDGYDGEWKLIDTINVRDNTSFPVVVGYLDECNVIITDRLRPNPHTYMIDINTKTSKRVITGSDVSLVISSALLNSGKVICSKYSQGCTGDSLTGCISVYDRQWKHTNDVTIPINTTRDFTRVEVDVDHDGMITAAEWVQSKIYVINPSDGKIINTITCKQNIVMRGVLSSGHIIAHSCPVDHRVFIIDRQGAQREITHSGVILNTCFDPMTDDLYVVTSDDEYKTCVIDRVMSGDDMEKRRVASFHLSTELDSLEEREYHLISSRPLMTSSGKLISCDGDNILVFKNSFTL